MKQSEICKNIVKILKLTWCCLCLGKLNVAFGEKPSDKKSYSAIVHACLHSNYSYVHNGPSKARKTVFKVLESLFPFVHCWIKYVWLRKTLVSGSYTHVTRLLKESPLNQIFRFCWLFVNYFSYTFPLHLFFGIVFG